MTLVLVFDFLVSPLRGVSPGLFLPHEFIIQLMVIGKILYENVTSMKLEKDIET